MTSPLRSLSRSISKGLGRTGSTSRLLSGDKLSLDDNMEVHVDEFTWPVKMKSEETPGKKVERVLAVGPEGLRILVPTTHEELGKYPYSKMKEYTYNTGHKVFQFTWLPSKTVEETIFLTTSKSRDIHEMIGKFLTNLLREKKGIKDPEKILNDCTYQRPPEIDKMKRGGTQRSYSTPSASGVKKIRKSQPNATTTTKKSSDAALNSSSPSSPVSTSDSIRPARSMPSGLQPSSSSSPSPKKKKRRTGQESSSEGSESDDEGSSKEEGGAAEKGSPTKKIVPASAPEPVKSKKRTPKKPSKESSDESESSDGETETRRISKSQQAAPASRRQQRRPKQRPPQAATATPPSTKKRGPVDDIASMRNSPLSQSAPLQPSPTKTPVSVSKRRPNKQ